MYTCASVRASVWVQYQHVRELFHKHEWIGMNPCHGGSGHMPFNRYRPHCLYSVTNEHTSVSAGKNEKIFVNAYAVIRGPVGEGGVHGHGVRCVAVGGAVRGIPKYSGKRQRAGMGNNKY